MVTPPQSDDQNTDKWQFSGARWVNIQILQINYSTGIYDSEDVLEHLFNTSKTRGMHCLAF